ncbi:histone-like nucleoid-structuring protein Lsr2 [Amycolatopsis sp. NPDC059090]|uniref:Lsr2 dimerization domain-containing protein n=1 Tax=Amycolatopsis sp. NPDC059090 TaxID=3346723 RepID=UPI00366DFFD6
MVRVTHDGLVDDLDGGPAAQTVEFMLVGVAYEIDLSDVHADALRAAVAPFAAAARRTRPGIQGAPRMRRPGAPLRVAPGAE